MLKATTSSLHNHYHHRDHQLHQCHCDNNRYNDLTSGSTFEALKAVAQLMIAKATTSIFQQFI